MPELKKIGPALENVSHSISIIVFQDFPLSTLSKSNPECMQINKCTQS